MFFPTRAEAQSFCVSLPGSYRIMRLTGIDYDALTVHPSEQA